MERFDEPFEYNCVVMRYSIGYMSDENAKLFLQKMTKKLACSNKERVRAPQRESYIVVQDQLVTEDRVDGEHKKQGLRK